MTEKLLPCPFCGGEAAVCDIEKPFVNGWIGCQRCRCFIDRVKNGEPQAIAAWNRRASDGVKQ
jgi:transcription elongation factor Elf1